MMTTPRSAITRATTILLLAVSSAFGNPLWGQNAQENAVRARQIMGVVEDWSTHHLVFSDPGSEEDAIRNGNHEKWLRIVNDPRYRMQQLKRRSPARRPASADAGETEAEDRSSGAAKETEPTVPDQVLDTTAGERSKPSKGKGGKDELKQDWSQGLTAAGIMPNTYPAKFSFSTTGTPSCAKDFAVYPTGATGVAGTGGAATIVAYNNLYVGSGTVEPSGPCETTNPTVYWAFNTTIASSAPGSVTTSPILSLDGTEVAFIQSTNTAAYLIVLKPTAEPSSTVTNPVSITSLSSNMNCTAPCMTATPLTKATSGDTYSSPFFDYVNNLLYVGDNNGYIYEVSNVFSTTAAPVATPLQLKTYNLASPVYDPTSGCVFVGDVQGYLYSVDPNVTGGSACQASSFSVHATSSALANSNSDSGIFDGPLVDSSAGTVYVFVSYSAAVTQSVTGTLTGGIKNFTITTSSLTQADVGNAISGTGLSGTTIATVTSATTGTLSGNASHSESNETLTITLANGSAGSNAVYQFPVGFSTLTPLPNKVENLGTGAAAFSLYAGSFDNIYYACNNSPTCTSPSGNLYVVGNAASTSAGDLYRVTIASNAMTAVTTVGALTNYGEAGGAYAWASPVTEFCNNVANACAVATGGACGSGVTCTVSPGVDTIYFSVYDSTVGGNCSVGNTQGCVLAYNVNSPLTSTSSPSGTLKITATSDSTAYGCFTTGAFIVDNASADTGSSQVYFLNLNGSAPSTITSSKCDSGTDTIQAVQVDQSTL